MWGRRFLKILKALMVCVGVFTTVIVAVAMLVPPFEDVRPMNYL